jgi:Fe-S-cluster containining protein
VSSALPSSVNGSLDCVACGACCFSAEAGYIEVFAVDRERMDAGALELTEVRDGRTFMRFGQGRCRGLALEASGRSLCSIYPMRPDACRWLAVGSGECHDQRSRKSAEVLLAVEKLRRSPAR